MNCTACHFTGLRSDDLCPVCDGTPDAGERKRLKLPALQAAPSGVSDPED